MGFEGGAESQRKNNKPVANEPLHGFSRDDSSKLRRELERHMLIPKADFDGTKWGNLTGK
ncbi:hypothetical protein AAVH_11152 [Aphelenchoides avenae]|nr:hypothetical protein AAVH_11152 [Aphelenchus avenae]